MSNNKLKDRIAVYENAVDTKLLPRVPLIITVNGRSFSKITSLLDKPYCPNLAECLYSTMLRLVNEVDGAIFAYSFNDEIVIIARNDQTLETNPWYDNKVQKIVSAISSVATLYFNNCAMSNDLNLMGDSIFLTKAFVVPNITEAINVIVSKQQQAFQSSIHFACFYELIKKYNKEEIKEMLVGTSLDEKIDLLHQEGDIDFNNYPPEFRRGVACYRSPTLINEGILKNKWTLNSDIPIFTRDHSFLGNIFKGGHDIVRHGTIIK
jgi:tRNA(His) guanylyltransferase